MVHFAEFLNGSLRSNIVTSKVNFNSTKIDEKYQNSNAIFLMMFKPVNVID